MKIYLLQNDKPVLTKLAMKSLADKLPPARFVRVHKSFMVAIDKISLIRKNRIYIGSHIIPVSDFYKEELLKAISHKL
jgi:DNA-binding LytR/AlgR family response regulator